MLLNTVMRIGTIAALAGTLWLYHDASRERAHARQMRAHFDHRAATASCGFSHGPGRGHGHGPHHPHHDPMAIPG